MIIWNYTIIVNYCYLNETKNKYRDILKYASYFLIKFNIIINTYNISKMMYQK